MQILTTEVENDKETVAEAVPKGMVNIVFLVSFAIHIFTYHSDTHSNTHSNTHLSKSE